LVTATFSISVPWILIVLVLLTYVVGTASQNTRREKCMSVILAIMIIYKTCNSVVVMGTFSIHNLLKYNRAVRVCARACVRARACVCALAQARVPYVGWQIFVCIMPYFRAWDLITLVEELDPALMKLDKGIWNAVGTEKPDTLVLRLQQMIHMPPHTVRDCSCLALLSLSCCFSFSPATPWTAATQQSYALYAVWPSSQAPCCSQSYYMTCSTGICPLNCVISFIEMPHMSYTFSMYNTCVKNGSAEKVRSGSQAPL
jgi:hypothetical protein